MNKRFLGLIGMLILGGCISGYVIWYLFNLVMM